MTGCNLQGVGGVSPLGSEETIVEIQVSNLSSNGKGGTTGVTKRSKSSRNARQSASCQKLTQGPSGN